MRGKKVYVGINVNITVPAHLITNTIILTLKASPINKIR